jgi:hypothetical protein
MLDLKQITVDGVSRYVVADKPDFLYTEYCDRCETPIVYETVKAPKQYICICGGCNKEDNTFYASGELALAAWDVKRKGR